jgi:hypothetical protein
MAARQATGVDGRDLVGPAKKVLHGLNLLPSQRKREDAEGFTAAFSGPPESVALIEAGATALGKWWSAGAGASVVAVWTGVARFYDSQPDPTSQRVLLWLAGIVSAALILAIAHVVNADLRSRAAVQVATVNARAEVARAVIEASASPGDAPQAPPPPPSGPAAASLVPQPAPTNENVAASAGGAPGAGPR